MRKNIILAQIMGEGLIKSIIGNNIDRVRLLLTVLETFLRSTFININELRNKQEQNSLMLHIHKKYSNLVLSYSLLDKYFKI